MKQQIQNAIRNFGTDDLFDAGIRLFDTLGYNTERQSRLDFPTYQGFYENFLEENDNIPDLRKFERRALTDHWERVELLFQLSESEMTNQEMLFDTKKVDDTIIEAYLFFAIRLRDEEHSRTVLSDITRQMNRVFSMPVMLLFVYGGHLTLSVIKRRLHKRDETRDVLEKVTLVKDIRMDDPHRAHIEILHDLTLEELRKHHAVSNFVELHNAWHKVLDCSELNKRFYKELANWYFWAVGNVTFPKDAEKNEEVRNATAIIRLLTRLIFVWFVKEKGLIPQHLFDREKLNQILNFEDKNDSNFYKAILQNLFFATLNQEQDKRGVRKSRQHYNVTNLYRYEHLFCIPPDEILKLFEEIPFLNGGLFDCLDKPHPTEKGPKGGDKVIRIDGFSDRDDNPLKVPDFLFFGHDTAVDLNQVFGTRGKTYKAKGLIHLLNKYKFTIMENTPITEEIALDPELLGKVFENLLASYNPETRTTARKQTGSFYTPREIVDYMADESLKASISTLAAKKMGRKATDEDIKTGLDILFAYTEEAHLFNEDEASTIVRAISELKILDPACGSGAFPMGILHKLVFILGKLDADNSMWRELQKEKAVQETENAYNSENREERQLKLYEIEHAFNFNMSDYGRKLYLIENCIYGVDIQPVAVQISMLRFFISLVAEQRVDRTKENCGIRPLPNLETKFVAANTLMGIEKPKEQRGISDNLEIEDLENELKEIRHKHFSAKTPKTKRKHRNADKEIRERIAELLAESFGDETTAKLLANWAPYNQNASADFFDPEWMFGIRDGFDIVIGNPPYVRHEKIKHLKPILKKQYKCYTGTSDLYVFFYEQGFNSLKPGGILSFISSNKYFRAVYGKKLREFLRNNVCIHQLIDFGDAPVFTAIAYPSIIVFEKSANVKESNIRALNWEIGNPIEVFPEIFERKSFSLSQVRLNAEAWRLESEKVFRLLEKLHNSGKPLGEYVAGRFYNGIKTGLNDAFIVDQSTRDSLINDNPSSTKVLKLFLRGKDVKRWQVNFANQYLIKIESSANVQHPWSDKPQKQAEEIFSKTYPAIHAYFQKFRKRLINRDDQGKYFWELRTCKYWGEFEIPKIVYPNICKRNEFAWDETKFYANQKAFIIPDASKYLLAVLNSSVVMWLFEKLLAKLQNGYYEPSAVFMKKFPIPVTKKTKLIENIVDNILSIKNKNSDADTTSLEKQIDLMVYKLYDLTHEEVKIVDPEFAMSRAEYENFQTP